MLTVLVFSLGWAAYPESAVGTTVMVLVVCWWGLGLRDSVNVWAIAASALLYGAHVAGTLASYGPPEMPLDGEVVRMWLRRTALTLFAAPVIYICVRWVRDIPEPAGVWVAGLAAALVVIAAASLMLSRRGDFPS
jgi:hypothetical protein